MHIFQKERQLFQSFKNQSDARSNNFVWKNSIFLPEYNAKRIKLISWSVYEKIVFKVNMPINTAIPRSNIVNIHQTKWPAKNCGLTPFSFCYFLGKFDGNLECIFSRKNDNSSRASKIKVTQDQIILYGKIAFFFLNTTQKESNWYLVRFMKK